MEDFAHQHQDVRVENGVQFGDLPEFCDFDYIAGVARVNAASLWSLAQAPGMPRDVKIDASVLTNDTVLRWTRDRPRRPGRLRGRVAADDQPVLDPRHRRSAPSPTTIDLSKDNVVFGIRSVSTDGYRSPAVFPFRA